MMHVKITTGTLHLDVEKSKFDLGSLIGFAARNNAKRGFLFISKVLGKHWPVKPSVMQSIHKELALQLSKFTFSTSPYFVGIAETATALGRGVFEEFCAMTGHRSLYSHTTRYPLDDVQKIAFSEEHSHAVEQWLHLPPQDIAAETIHKADTLVMIDDEVTTGKTFLNLIKSLEKHMPQLKRVIIITLIDMTGSKGLAHLQEEIPFAVESISLLHGSFSFEAAQNVKLQEIVPRTSYSQHKHILPSKSGRLGIFPNTWKAQTLPYTVPSMGNVLVLGSGEFMYEPYRLALALENQGHEVYFQATTRSPILHGHDIKSILSFVDNYHENIDNYLYNVQCGQYDNVVVCYETASLPEEHQLAETLGATCCFFTEEDVKYGS